MDLQCERRLLVALAFIGVVLAAALWIGESPDDPPVLEKPRVASSASSATLQLKPRNGHVAHTA